MLGDLFHYIDWPNILLHHEHKKSHKVTFLEAFLACNSNKLTKLKFAMNQDGISNADIKKKIYFNCDMFKECVDQRVLPPSLPYWQVCAVFISFENTMDSKSKKPLSNKMKWGKSDNILK